MARKDRSKQLWLIPKRSSLTQTVGLVGAVLKLNYDGTVWSPGKQNNLGAQMAKFGVTRSGRNISDQSVRTLTASLPQSLGFLYLDTTEKPHRLRLT